MELDSASWRDRAKRLEYRNQAFIDGRFTPAQSGATFPTRNPATEEVLTEVASCDAPDVDLAASFAVFGITFNQGEVCSANSRLLIDRRVRDAFFDAFLEKIAEVEPGDPLDPATPMGPPRNTRNSRQRGSASARDSQVPLVESGKVLPIHQNQAQPKGDTP